MKETGKIVEGSREKLVLKGSLLLEDLKMLLASSVRAQKGMRLHGR